MFWEVSGCFEFYFGLLRSRHPAWFTKHKLLGPLICSWRRDLTDGGRGFSWGIPATAESGSVLRVRLCGPEVLAFSVSRPSDPVSERHCPEFGRNASLPEVWLNRKTCVFSRGKTHNKSPRPSLAWRTFWLEYTAPLCSSAPSPWLARLRRRATPPTGGLQHPSPSPHSASCVPGRAVLRLHPGR